MVAVAQQCGEGLMLLMLECVFVFAMGVVFILSVMLYCIHVVTVVWIYLIDINIKCFVLVFPTHPGPFLLQCYQLGSQPTTAMFHSEENGSKGMDPLVLIDAIAICMAYEEKELCKIGEVALAVIFDVATIILGSKDRVSH